MYSVKKMPVSVTGVASLGWRLGRGFVTEKFTVKVDKWSVVADGVAKPICICQGKAKAQEIADAMNQKCGVV